MKQQHTGSVTYGHPGRTVRDQILCQLV